MFLLSLGTPVPAVGSCCWDIREIVRQRMEEEIPRVLLSDLVLPCGGVVEEPEGGADANGNSMEEGAVVAADELQMLWWMLWWLP